MTRLIDYLVIGVLQGVFEWLPVSSKTVVFLYALFISRLGLAESYVLGLAVQAGSILSALMYYRDLLFSRRDLFVYKYVVIASISTAVTGIPLYVLFLGLLGSGVSLGLLTILIGLLLLVLGFLHMLVHDGRGAWRSVRIIDAVYMGLAQGFSVIPGVSRSGVTVLALLARGCSVEESFKYSFVSSIPANLGALILVALSNRDAHSHGFDLAGFTVSLIISSIIGYYTIDFLLKAARRYSWRTTLVAALIAILVGVIALLSQ